MSASATTVSPSVQPVSQQAQTKSPIVAALLNFFLFGIGYWYLGYKKILGVQTGLFIIVMLVLYALLGFFTSGIVTVIIAIVLAYDGYVKAKGQKGLIGAEL